MRKTKIICTLGPAACDAKTLRDLIRAGMNAARINLSHETHEAHRGRIELLKRAREELGAHIPIILDTKGPEIRTGIMKNGGADLVEGADFVLTTENIEGDEKAAAVSYEGLPREVKKGSRILIDDGLIELVVQSVLETKIYCKVKYGGRLVSRKSVNLPGAAVNMPYMSEGDRRDIIFGIQNGVDFIAASFVRSAYDVLEVRKILEQNGGAGIKIIAKIENSQGVLNIDEIIKVCDGIMIARGDMGVEIPLEELPRIQKVLIKKCYLAGKMATTATQMLESMIRNPRPTRAEVTDVANAIYDGTSSIMLSGETAIGQYPVESVKTMAQISETTENAIDYKKRFSLTKLDSPTVTKAISHATCMTAHDLGAAAIITVTKSGQTARMVSRFRPLCPIIATAMTSEICRQLQLSWGVYPVLVEERDNTDDLYDHALARAMSTNMIKNGDLVVLTGGVPVGVSGTTNSLKVHLVGNILVQGVGTGAQSASANVYVAKSYDDALSGFSEGDILVIKDTADILRPVLGRAAGIICEAEGLTTHAAIAGMALGIPVVTGAKGATESLKTGTMVTIDGARGLVYSGVTKIL